MALDLTYNNGKAPNLEEILSALQVTPEGLTAEHVRYCTMIATAGGYAGLDLMTTLMGLPPRAVVDLETELIKQGMIERQKSGRALTAKGYRLAGPLRSRRFGAAAIRESRAAAADRVESMFQGRQR
jgi:Holliday junction resolvasome RuvABC ATP-dependent DNA helicase subunit